MEDYRLIPPICTADSRHKGLSTVAKKRTGQVFGLSPEELASFMRYEVSNHPDIDPLRPMGYHDSWAGKVKYKWARHRK